MARPESITPSGGPPHDELDTLFDPDQDLDDIFNNIREDIDTAGNNTHEPSRQSTGNVRRSEALGIDEEVTITKKRQPVAKLDATRLLSDPGIPKLHRISKSRLKFRGKGHEFSDVAQLLRTYQFWLDDLYPRAKFADGLAIIEKLGHSKRMQVMRKAWIDESKPKASLEEEKAEHERLPATPNPGSQRTVTAVMHANMSAAEASPRPNTGVPENDIISERRTSGLGPSASSPGEEVRGAPDEDELDALFAEESLQFSSRIGNSLEMTPSPGVHRPKSLPEQSYDDDEEAMREMDAFW